MDSAPRVASLAEAVASIDARLQAAPPPAPLVADAAGPRVARFLQCTAAGTRYAISEVFITELDRVPRITLVPGTPDWLRGVANLRGDVLSIVDLRAFLGLDATSRHTGRMVVLRLPDEEISIGVLVDAVDQIATLALDTVRPPASPLEGPLAPFLAGTCVAGGQVVAVIDVERLLRSAEIRQFEDVREDSSCEGR